MNIFKAPWVIFTFISLSDKSPLKGFWNRWEITRVLIILLVKMKLHPKTDRLICMKIFGFQVWSYDYKTLNSLFREIFVKGSYHFKPQNNNKIEIIDGGAHLGMSVLYWKKLYPSCEIQAFEPNPHLFPLLEKNMLVNKLTKVRCYPLALGISIGKSAFFLNDHKGTQNGSLILDVENSHSIMVDTTLLSNIIGDNHMDLVKLDIEGSEGFVLEDLIASHKLHQVKEYIVEYHPSKKTNMDFHKMKYTFENAHFKFWTTKQAGTEILIHAKTR